MAEPFATRREFDDFREETRDELKWLRRGVIWVLIASVAANLAGTIAGAVFRSPP